MIGKKNCLHEKKCLNKLSALEVHLEKIVCRDHLCYARFEKFFKKLSAQPEWRKRTCKRSIDSEKKFLPPKNHDTPPPPPPPR